MESNLTKEDIYAMSAKLMETNAPIAQDHLVTFVRLLNKDVLCKDNHKLLQTLRMLMNKIKDGIYPKVTQLRDTLMALIQISISDSQMETVLSDISALEILLDIPNDIFHDSCAVLNGPMLLLLESCLSSSTSRHNQLVVQLLSKYSSCMSQIEKDEFGEKILNFFLSQLVPSLFLVTNDPKEIGITMANLIFPLIAKINYFKDQHWLKIYANIVNPDKYPQVLIKYLNSDDPIWSKLWILITKISGKELHRMGKSINPFLTVLQEAFKKGPEFKTQSFYCLKALIENFALEKSVLFHMSRVKVVSIAFEINNAKTENVASIKFEVWWLLITLLKPKMTDFFQMIYLPFLKYCFGEIDSKGLLNSNFYPGKSFECIQKLAIKSFTETLGHFECPGCSGDIVKLNGSIIDPEILDCHYDVLINALKQSTKYAVTHMLKGDKATFEELKQNIRCIWKSFIKLSSNTNLKNFSSIFKKILNLIKDLIKENSQDAFFAEAIMTLIIPSIVIKNFGYSHTAFNDTSIKLSNNLVPIQHVFKSILMPNLYHKDTMSELNFDFKTLIEIGLLGDANQFSTWLVNELVVSGYCPQIWCCLANIYITNPEKIDFKLYNSILKWPVTLYTSNIRIVDVSSTWCRFYNTLNPKLISFKDNDANVVDEGISSFLLKICSKNNKSDLNLIPLFLLPFVIKKNSEANPGKIAPINRLIVGLDKYLLYLQSAKMSYNIFVGLGECLNNLAIVLYDCYSYHVSFSSYKIIIPLLNNTIKMTIIFFEKNYQESDNLKIDFHTSIQMILNGLKKLSIPDYFSSLRDGLLNILEVLMNTVQNSEIQNECTNLLNNMMEPDINTSLGKSDIMKIQLILKSKNKPKESSIVTKEQSNFSFPNQIKSDGKKCENPKEDFVVIKPNWKFDPKNLTEHQKEVLKRRRDDIPALYEDLSQSQDECSIKTWRLPGCKSNENSSSQEQSSQEINHSNKMLAKKNSKSEISNKKILNKASFDGEKVENTPALLINEKTHITPKRKSIADDFKDICSSAAKNSLFASNVENSPEVQDSAKLNVKIINNTDSKSDKSKKKSIFSRLHENLQSLKSTNDKNLTYVVNGNLDDEIINCTEDINITIDETAKKIKNSAPVNKKPIIITKDSVKKIEILSEKSTNNLSSKILEFEDVHEKNDGKMTTKRKATELNDQKEEVTNEINLLIEVPNKNVLDKKKSSIGVQKTVIAPNRPSRVRRKPNKFLNEELNDKKSKGDMSKNDRLSLPVIKISDSVHEQNDIKNDPFTPESKNLEDSESNIFDNFGTPKSSKKKARLMNQLAIDTKEGHPLMEINAIDKKSNVRKTRRSLGMTTITKTTKKSKKVSSLNPKKDNFENTEISLRNEKSPDDELDDIENSQTKSDKSNKKHKHSLPSNENSTGNFEGSFKPVIVSDAITGQLDKNTDLKNIPEFEKNEYFEINVIETEPLLDLPKSTNVTCEYKLAENKEIISDSNPVHIDNIGNIESSPQSIFSQETEIISCTKIPISSVISKDENNSNDITFLNDREPFLNEETSQNLDKCSPDCIESSQDESLSSISLKIIMSKPKTNESKLNEMDDTILPYQLGTSKPESESSMLTTQELAEADTEILSCEPFSDHKLSDESDVLADKTPETEVKFLRSTIDTSIDLNDSNSPSKTEDLNSLDLKSENVCLNDAPMSPVNHVKNISILSSPCNDDVEDRNNEFLNNTIDISPIKDDPNPSDILATSFERTDNEVDAFKENGSTSIAVQVTVTSPDIFTNERPVPVKENQPVEYVSPPKNSTTPSMLSKSLPSLSHLNSRTVQMLNMCMLSNFDDLCTKITHTNKRKDSNNALFLDKLNTELNPMDTQVSQPLFELKKTLPCLTASPGGPILKRKFESDELAMSPSSKKKRVSFHDPIVSTTVNVEKYIGSKSNLSPLNKDIQRVNGKQIVKKNYAMVPRSLTPKLDLLATETSAKELENEDFPINLVPPIVMNSDSISDLCSLKIDSPQSVGIAQNDLLDDKVAIYPDLVNCKTSISEIASLLSSSLWKEDFIKEIEDKIQTIGDLAKLTAADVNRLPIKYPKVESVREVLATYDTNLHRALFTADVSTDDNSQNEINENLFENSSIQTVHNKSTFNEADVPDDISKIFGKVDDAPIVGTFNEKRVNEINSSNNSQDTSPLKLLSNQGTEEDETKKMLTSFIKEKPEEALKVICDAVDHNIIFDNIPFSSILSYLKSKTSEDEDTREKVLESLDIDKIKVSKKENLNNALKLFRNTFSANSNALLNSIDEFLDL